MMMMMLLLFLLFAVLLLSERDRTRSVPGRHSDRQARRLLNGHCALGAPLHRGNVWCASDYGDWEFFFFFFFLILFRLQFRFNFISFLVSCVAALSSLLTDVAASMSSPTRSMVSRWTSKSSSKAARAWGLPCQRVRNTRRIAFVVVVVSLVS
jgi:hypothetical protein